MTTEEMYIYLGFPKDNNGKFTTAKSKLFVYFNTMGYTKEESMLMMLCKEDIKCSTAILRHFNTLENRDFNPSSTLSTNPSVKEWIVDYIEKYEYDKAILLLKDLNNNNSPEAYSYKVIVNMIEYINKHISSKERVLNLRKIVSINSDTIKLIAHIDNYIESSDKDLLLKMGKHIIKLNLYSNRVDYKVMLDKYMKVIKEV